MICYYCKNEITHEIYMGHDKSFCTSLHRSLYSQKKNYSCPSQLNKNEYRSFDKYIFDYMFYWIKIYN